MDKRIPLFWNETQAKVEALDVNKPNDSWPDISVGGEVTIPDTAYASNAEALAALGAGRMYKSTTSIEGSPIILMTV